MENRSFFTSSKIYISSAACIILLSKLDVILSLKCFKKLHITITEMEKVKTSPEYQMASPKCKVVLDEFVVV